MGPQGTISWPVLTQMRDRWAGRIALEGVSLAMLDHYVGKDGERLADLIADHGGILGAVVIDDPEPKLERVFLWRAGAASISTFTRTKHTTPIPTGLKRLQKPPSGSDGRAGSLRVTVAA